MGTAQVQGELWNLAPEDWTNLQEPKHIPLFKAMLDAAHVDSGTRVFDAGCGGGGASVLAAERGARVSGLDAATALIELAQQRVPSGDFRVGDMEDLPFETDAFDAVIAANSVQYTADRVAALRELGRVCAPESRIVVGLFSTPDNVEFRHVFKAVRDTLPEPPPGDGPFGLSAPGTLEGLIEDAGLKVLASDEVNCPFLYSDFETFWRANASAGPFQGVIRVVGETRLRAVLQDTVAAYRNGNGSFEIGPNLFRYVVASLQTI